VHLAQASGSKGHKLKGFLNKKNLVDAIIFFKRTYSVKFKIDCKPKELLQ
jgi:hypothetical protein